jgi:hypothetical protein
MLTANSGPRTIASSVNQSCILLTLYAYAREPPNCGRPILVCGFLLYPPSMPWKRLYGPERSELPRAFNRKTRFLVDEGLGIGVAEYLREAGYNVRFAGDVDLRRTRRGNFEIFEE